MSKSSIIINHESDDKNHHIPNSMLSYVLEPCDLEKKLWINPRLYDIVNSKILK